MENLSCSICCNNFDNDLYIPCVVSCGHTFCRTCITSLQEKSGNCPLCSIPLQQGQHFPTNLGMLSLVSSFKQNQKRIIQGIYKSKEIVQRMNTCMKALKETEERNKEYEKSLKLYIHKFTSWEETAEEPESSFRDLEQIEEKLSAIENALEIKMPKLRYNVELGNVQECLFKIYNGVINGEKVNLAHWVNGKAKFGQISVWNNQLFFHSLSSDTPENENYIVKLDDLSRGTLLTTFRLFLKIQCNSEGIEQVVIIYPKNHSLTPQFVYLCTGEFGLSYKGIKFTTDKLNSSNLFFWPILTAKFSEDWEEKNQPKEYVMNFAESTVIEEDSTIVFGIEKGGFQIVRPSHKSSRCCPMVGVVEWPLNLKDIISYKENESLFVKDCGIMFRL